MFPSSAENSGKCYSQPLFGSFLSSESVETNGSDRYGAYESFKLGSLSTEVAERIYDNSNGGCSDTYLSTWSSDVMTDWDKPYLMSSQRSRSPFSDSSIESQYSTSDSSSLYSPNHSRPAAIGSRGRDMHPYMQRNYCGRGAVVPEASGLGVGCSSQNPSIRIDRYYTNAAALVFRGTKRKMMEPVPPCKLVKRKRMFRAACNISSSVGLNISKDGCICPDNKKTDEKHVDGKKVRAREKRRRRREKNHEKYGRKHRWAFTCALCKFHTFEDKDIENHFGSTYHRETLDYIRQQARFDDKVISFLHDCMVHKFHKTVSTLHKLKSSCGRSKDEWAKKMEEVTDDDYMRRMEVFYCVACDTHIPSVFTSVQQHLHSFTHLKSKEAYKEQLKRDSVITAKAIINNDNMKGEDPFAADAKDKSSDSQDQERSDEAEEDESENSDSYQWK